MTVRRHTRPGRGGTSRSYWIVDVQVKQRDGTVRRARRVPRQQTKAAAERLERELINLFSAAQEIVRETASESADVTSTEVVPFEKTAGDAPDTKVATPRVDSSDGVSASGTVTLAAFAERFMQSYSRVQNKISEQQSKERILRRHLLPTLGRVALERIDTWAVDEYIASKRTVLAAKTINNHLAVLARMLQVAKEWQILSQLPRIRFLRTIKPHIDFLESHEVAQLYEAMSSVLLRSMAMLALNTGLRLGEMLALKRGAVDLSRKRLMVRLNLSDDGSLGTPKSGKSREVPLNKLAIQALTAVLEMYSHDFVFARPNGRPLTRMMAYGPLVAAMIRCSLHKTPNGERRRLGWHMLRHTFASHLVMKNVPLRAIQELLGHASIDMTMRYAHLTPAAARSAFDVLAAGERQRHSY